MALLSARTRAALLITTALGLSDVQPESAGAAVSVSASGATLQIGATNVNPFVTIDHQLGDYVISDGGGASPGPGCTANGSGQVRCDDTGITQLSLSALPDAGAVMSGNVVTLPTGVSILLQGGSGNDIFNSGDGNDTLHGGAGSNDIDGADGNDTIDTTGSGSQILTGGNGDDTLTGAGGNNIIDGGEFDGDNTDGNDVITGGALQDNLDGGGGNDTINAGGDDDTDVTGGAGDDTLNGGDGDDTLDGGRNPSGAQDTDTLNGDANDDTLLNSDGPDTFNGGVGADTVDYSATTGSGAIIADADGQSGDDGRTGEQDTVGSTVENLTGDSGADVLTGNAQANVLSGQGGDDTLKGGAGTGADGADTFDGGTGTGDTVSYAGRTSGVVVDVDGASDDGAGGCPAAAGCEDDNLGATVENVIGGSGSDTLTGSNSNNDLRGGAGGDDVLSGLGADDQLFGGTGVNGGPDGADTFNGGTGVDTASYGGRSDDLIASIAGGSDGAGGCPSGAGCEDDAVATDVEKLTGGTGDDALTGDSDGNTIDGGLGNDTLTGGTATTGSDGPDVFTGGGGTDTVSYASRTTAVFASIDGVAFDGNDCPVTGPCEKDNVGLDVEKLIGGGGDDTLIGDADANTLTGNGGGDELQGGATDVDGTDVFSGGPGVDRVNYTDKTRDLVVTLGDGADGAGGCPSGGGCEDDDVTADVEEVVGGRGNDHLTGNASDNQVIGGLGNDVLSGGFGNVDGADRFAGGGDTDTVDYSGHFGTHDLTIDGVANDGTACPAGPSCEGDDIELDVENLIGGPGNDHMTGDLDPNRLDGGSGDDVLEGGGTGSTADGADTFVGDQGLHDQVTYADRTVPVTVVAAPGSLNGIGGCPSGAGCEGDVIGTDTEDLTGGQDDDNLSGNGAGNTIDGQGGDDVMSGSLAPADRDGADTFIGGTHGTAGGANGSTGDLVDYSHRQQDLVVGIGGGADDGATGCPGAAGCERDDVRSTVERVTTGDGNDTITGDSAVNALIGGAGNDTIAGGGGAGPDGADVLQGGTGTGDTISYATRTDNLSLTINGAAPDGDQVTGFENATGGSGSDTITGTAVANRLTGGLGTDTLSGLAGADRLEARDGVADSLDCGNEADVAVVDAGTLDTVTGCETVDAAAPPADPPVDPPADPGPPAGTDPPANPPSGGTGADPTPPPSGTETPAGPGETGTGGGGNGAEQTLSLAQNAATLTVPASGKLVVTVRGPAGTNGKLTIVSKSKIKVGKGKKARRKIVKLASASFRVGAKGTVKVPLTLSASNRKLLGTLKTIKTVVTATAPRLSPATTFVTFKAPKRVRAR